LIRLITTMTIIFNRSVIFETISVSTLLFIFYFFLKIPTLPYPLAFYDDAETLYHTLILSQNKIPYVDDYTHHFLGYILPFYLIAKCIGICPAVVTLTAAINQTATASVLYHILKLVSTPPLLCLLGALLLISAREPWVLSFFQQYQINLLIVLIWYFGIKAIKHLTDTRKNTSKSTFLMYEGLSWLSAGVATIYDQRAVVLLTIPFMLTLILHVSKNVQLDRFATSRQIELKTLLAYAFINKKKLLLRYMNFLNIAFLPAALCILYLWNYGALEKFFEQTLLFPFLFRSGSKGLSNSIYDSYRIYLFLIVDTPILVCAGIVGGFYIFQKIKNSLITGFFPHSTCNILPYLLLCSSLPALFVMPLLGGRPFQYYSITWLPLLVLASIISIRSFKRKDSILFKTYLFFLSAPLLLSLINVLRNIPVTPLVNTYYEGDGINEVTDYLQHNMSPDDSIYVWGYRLDVYTSINKTALFPFANNLIIHPDNKISAIEDRLLHIYPKYQEEFTSLLSNSKKNLPTFIVTHERELLHDLDSPSKLALYEKLYSDYQEVFRIKKKDFTNRWNIFVIYKLKSIPLLYEHFDERK
jgi:hypothetical protein